jgi:hypothetical protein
MRLRLECLCCDCRQRALISAGKRTGNEVPAAVANYERGIDLVYFSNALLVDDTSQSLLAFFKLREDAPTTTAISTCCGTLMCGIHPSYEGCSIIINADSCNVTALKSMETQAVVFCCDIPSDKWAELQKRDNIPKVFSVFDELETAPMVAAFTAVKVPIDDQYMQPGSTTLEELCAGKDIGLDNSFFDESRVGKPETPNA